MSATYLGSLSIGGVMPGAAAVGIAGAAGINAVLPDLTDRLNALLSFSPTPITIAAQITQLEAMITALNAQVTLGVAPPSMATQLAAIGDIIAALQGSITNLNAYLVLINGFQAALGAAGVHAIAYEGTVATMGAEVAAELATVPVGPNDPAHGLVLLTTVPATWAALATILRVTP